jgi:hypothetical protein
MSATREQTNVRGPFLIVFSVAVGAVIGFVVGRVPLRVELSEREDTIAHLEERLAEGGGGTEWRSPVPGLDRILRTDRDVAE